MDTGMNPNRLNHWARKPLRIVLRLWFLAALVCAFALAVSDALLSTGRPELLRYASFLAPLDSRIHWILAGVDPTRAPTHLERIRELSPVDARIRIQDALIAEQRGDLAAAERELLEAARLDRTFLPRWTLINFYFRRQRWPEFWEFSRSAASLYRGDLSGVFRLCLRIEPDPLTILRKLEATEAGARLDLLRVLTAAENYSAAGRIAPMVANDGLPDSRDLLLETCHQAGVANQAEAAVELWNALVQHKRFAGVPLRPKEGVSLNNGTFERAPTGACFDWKPARMEFIRIQSLRPQGLAIELSGRQSDTEALLEHWLPLVPNSRYRLSWTATEALKANSSPLEWWVDGEALAILSTKEAVFDSGSRTIVRLYLTTRRKPGKIKPEGIVEIRNVTLRML